MIFVIPKAKEHSLIFIILLLLLKLFKTTKIKNKKITIIILDSLHYLHYSTKKNVLQSFQLVLNITII